MVALESEVENLSALELEGDDPIAVNMHRMLILAIALECMKIADANESLDHNCRIEDIYELDKLLVTPATDRSRRALLE
jgi:hypothetical protein